MCDYSLDLVASRPAKVGDKLVTTKFQDALTRGFAGNWRAERGSVSFTRHGDRVHSAKQLDSVCLGGFSCRSYFASKCSCMSLNDRPSDNSSNRPNQDRR